MQSEQAGSVRQGGSAALPAGKRSSQLSRRFKQNVPLWIMFIPVAVFYIVFKYTPMLGLVIAFKNYTFYEGIWGSAWTGLQNFEHLFTQAQSVQIIRNTLLLSVLTVFVGFPFPIMLAIMMNEARKMWFKRTVQTLVYLPHFFSWVIVGGIVVTLFSQSGAVNALVEKLTGEAYPFLFREWSWIAVFLGSGIWKEAGFSAIIYLAALTTIDPSLYEASSMDGAGKWKQLWHVTLPGISSTIVLMLILAMGRVMEVGFDQVYVLQNSIVANISEVISTFIYQIGLQGGQFSLTAALGLFESLVGLVLVLITNAIAKRFNKGLW
ncbi:putative aldouronate transport system permease protein [Paenibacillus sp. UNCCL117]|nr:MULTISPECIES: ABC transporter permease subunit [unclassified Paenibacillus]SDC07639.1 putative aldouronate transport system permease protein [Paenibacillus sp. cl123]SFW38091.1 putative aldouronate transport system permease protein [Paenibacillus sp. UNCCL117]